MTLKFQSTLDRELVPNEFQMGQLIEILSFADISDEDPLISGVIWPVGAEPKDGNLTYIVFPDHRGMNFCWETPGEDAHYSCWDPDAMQEEATTAWDDPFPVGTIVPFSTAWLVMGDYGRDPTSRSNEVRWIRKQDHELLADY